MVNISQSVLIHFVARDDLSGPVGIMSGALLGFGGAAAKVASDFETEFAKFASLVPKTKNQLANFKTEVLDMSKAVGVDAVKSMDALYEAISAGVPEENAMTFLETSAKAAVAGVTDTKNAVDGMTSAINAFGTGFQNAERTADIMFQAVNIGKMTFDQMSKSIYIAGPIAANTGVKFEELAAAQATITKSGSSASVAMTQVRSALTALNKPTGNLQELLHQLGAETGPELIENMGGLQAAFEAIRNQADANGMSLAKLFGRVEAVNGILALTGENAAIANQDLAAITHSAGAMERAFKKIDDTPARRWARAIAEMKVAAIGMGNAVLPAVEGVIDVVRNLISIFEGLPEPVQASAGQLSMLIGALGIGTAVVIRLSEAFKVLSAAIVHHPIIAGTVAITTALIALGEVVSRLTSGGKLGLMDRIFGDSAREKEIEASLDRMYDRLAAINELWPVGTGSNIGAKEREIKKLTGSFFEFGTQMEKNKEEVDKLSEGVDGLGADIFNTLGKFVPGGRGGDSVFEKYNKDMDKTKGMLKELDVIYQDMGLTTNELSQHMERLKETLIDAFGEKLGLELYEDFIKTSETGQELTEKLEILNDEIIASGDAFFRGEDGSYAFSEAIQETELTAEELEEALEGLEGAITSLVDSYTTLNPEVLANNIQMARNNLEIARIKDSARNADGSIRDLTEGEQALIDQLEESNDSLGRHNDVFGKTREVIDANLNQLNVLAKRYGGVGSEAADFEVTIGTLAQTILSSLGPTDAANVALENLGVLLNEDISSETAIQAVDALTDTLGSESKEWKDIIAAFPPEFWQEMIDGIGDPAEKARLSEILKGNLDIDVTTEGESTGLSFTSGLEQGIITGGEGAKSAARQLALDVAAIVADVMFIRSPSKLMHEMGVNVARGLAEGIEEGASEAEKAAAEMAQNIVDSFDGFSEAIHDALRLNALTDLFGELGGELADAIAEAFEDPSASAGSAVANSLDSIIDVINDKWPAEEAAAWGAALVDAVANAMLERTPEAAEAVRILIRAIMGELEENNDAVDAANTLGDAIMEALRRRYEEAKRLQEKSLDAAEEANDQSHKIAMKEIDIARDAAEASQEIAQKAAEADIKRRKESLDTMGKLLKDALEAEKKAKEKALDDEEEALDKALQAEIDLRDTALDAISEDLSDANKAENMEELQTKLARAKTNSERVKIQKEINKAIREEEADNLKKELEAEIDALEDKRDELKDDFDNRRELMDTYYDAKEAALEADLDRQKAALEAEEDAVKAHYDSLDSATDRYYDDLEDKENQRYENEKTRLENQRDQHDAYWADLLSDQNLFNEALIMLQNGNMEDIISLLETYYGDWQNAGQSLGEALIFGLNSTQTSLRDAVNEMLGSINVAREAAGIPTIPNVGGSTPTPSSGGRTYTVKPGDTLSDIAASLGLSWQDLWGLNSDTISDPNLIFPGQILKYARGGRVRGGLSMINELGPELVNLPSGSNVMTAQSTEKLFKKIFSEIGMGDKMSGGAPQVINIHIGNERLASFVVDATNKHARLNY